MKFRLTIRNQGEEGEWTESYDKPVGRVTSEWGEYHPDNKLRGRTLKAVEEWGRALIEWFNSTLGKNEKNREFVLAEIVGTEKGCEQLSRSSVKTLLFNQGVSSKAKNQRRKTTDHEGRR